MTLFCASMYFRANRTLVTPSQLLRFWLELCFFLCLRKRKRKSKAFSYFLGVSLGQTSSKPVGRASADDKQTLVLFCCFVSYFRCVCMSAANARPTGLLGICHSETPKKYEKAFDFVFRFLKEKKRSSSHACKSCDGAKKCTIRAKTPTRAK